MENKEKNFISAVIYVHNAQERIENFLNTVMKVLRSNFEHSEIICVNDASVDSSIESIYKYRKLAGSNISITVLNMSSFHGLEMAMNAGTDLAIGDFVFEFDTTVMDFDESEIMKIYKRSLSGYDIVSASPNKKQGLASGIFYHLFGCFTGSADKMYTESFRILSRRVINRVSSMDRAVPYRKAAYARCGLRSDHMVYEPVPLKCGKIYVDKTERKYRRMLAVDVMILFTDVGWRFSAVMTTLMMLAAVFGIVYSVVTYLAGSPVEGWTTTMLFLSAAFFGLFGILTVIIKYLQLLIDLVFRRKRYSFESIEKLT